ncbi:MAG: hypothetical protein AAFX81_15620 [Pseudomonadota bacterium]
MSRYVTVVQNARLLDPASGLDAPGGVRIEDGVVVAIGPRVTTTPPSPHELVVDAGGQALIPGLVDMRVRFGEPGEEQKETYESGSAAALAGGVTSVGLLPDTDPVIDDPAMVEYVARRARRARGAGGWRSPTR